ncbi:hypothetical protein HPP92_010617 [Vanilla planifolia]|uniref:Uncharacterized protein n=1 Tax=Vanilla planifolia TaxID=51239 RepID=A0A835R0F5_VANPL|nr:hypothetical protein HPP92_010617 [Vanilla planifolia]
MEDVTPSDSGARTQRPRRKPFSDLSNIPSLASASALTPISSSKSKLRPKSHLVTISPTSSSLADVSSSCSSTSVSTSVAVGNSNPARVIRSRIARGISNALVCSVNNCNRDEHSTVDIEKVKEKDGDKGKGASACAPLSCPPFRKIRTAGKSKHVSFTQHGPYSVSCEKRKKRKLIPESSEKSEYKLPQEFIDEHRAYFAEVDAFELPEEVVSESWKKRQASHQDLLTTWFFHCEGTLPDSR